MKALIEKLHAGIDLSPEDISYSVAVLLRPLPPMTSRRNFSRRYIKRAKARRRSPDLSDNSSIARSILAWNRKSFPDQ
jgi:hypothetical protein